MNLIVDVGNSFVKIAVFKGEELISSKSLKYEEFIVTIDDCIKEFFNVEKCIISSVIAIDTYIVNKLKEVFKVLVLDKNTKLPFKNKYKTPNTLGSDRLALVSASVSAFPNKKEVLVIDAGTCITYDFIDQNNCYLGGAISPGIKMRYESLHKQTANLPLLSVQIPEDYIGNSTSNSIHSGVIQGVLHEIDGNIEEYKKKYKNLTILLTGGDAKFLSKQLKSSIFANSNFLLQGLNYILQFNLK